MDRTSTDVRIASAFGGWSGHGEGKSPLPLTTQLGHGAVRARESDKFGILWQDRPYSALMPANLITLAHFSMASEMIAPNSAGEPPSTVPPSSTIRALILLSARPALSSLFSISMMSAGVVLGAPMPAKPRAPKPRTERAPV